MAVDSLIGADLNALPDECIASVLSLTSPKDACRSALVASNFHSAAQFDLVWERFLPSGYRDIISRAANAADLLNFTSMKSLYLYLCDHPIIIDGGSRSFSLEKSSGKICYMLSPRSMQIAWGDDTRYWKWVSLPSARFSEVAELRFVWWFEIRGEISAKFLSPNTTYAAYLVFTWASNPFGFDSLLLDASVGIHGQEAKMRVVSLESNSNLVETRGQVEYSKMRSDGLMEVELGEIFVTSDGDDCVEISLMEVKMERLKCGLFVQGIEIRPKEAKL